MFRKRSFWVVVTLCIVLLVVFFVMRGRETRPQAEAPKSAAVVDVSRGDVANTLTVAGQFQPYQNVELHAKVSGYIRSIRVDIGDRVHKGEVLAVLEVPELAAQLEGVKAEVRHSQSEIARQQSEVVRAQSTYSALHTAYTRLAEAAKERPGLIAAQELDDFKAKDMTAQAQIDVAKASLEAAQQQMAVAKADNDRVQSLENYTTIVAPFNGVVTMRYADVGSLIQAGTRTETQSEPVVTLAQSDLLRLRSPVPESDVPFIKEGGEVKIQVSSTGRTFIGHIVRFTRAVDDRTRTMLVEVDVPNPDLTLTTGMYAETTIELRHIPDALTLPAQAVVQDGSQAYIYVVNDQNRVETRTVTLGIQTANRIQLLTGVKAGERVIASGQAQYHTGELVHPEAAFIPTQKEEVAE